MKDPKDFKLTKSVTVGEVMKWIGLKDNVSKGKLVDLINHRFEERYLKHIHDIESGFLKMGVACLMIETIESFKQGIKDTSGRSEKMFVDFFASEINHFPGFDKISKEFYKRIRCGILHQAETTRAWRILLTGKLLDERERCINAKAFVGALRASLQDYIAELNLKDWNDPIWKNAILKLIDICENCKPDP